MYITTLSYNGNEISPRNVDMDKVTYIHLVWYYYVIELYSACSMPSNVVWCLKVLLSLYSSVVYDIDTGWNVTLHCHILHIASYFMLFT